MRHGARTFAVVLGGLAIAGCQARGPALPPGALGPAPAAAEPGVRALLASDHVPIPGATFGDPTAITNPYAPYGEMERLVLEGTSSDGEGGTVATRSVQTVLAETRTFRINGEKVEALIVEDRAYEDGELVEVALDYYAQSDHGTVYYLGEHVDNYEDGKIVDHGGTWLFGRDTSVAGVIMPASPTVGTTFSPEAVPARGSREAIAEDAVVVATGLTFATPVATYTGVIRVRLVTQDGEVESKWFAPGVGVIAEEDPDGSAVLTAFE